MKRIVALILILTTLLTALTALTACSKDGNEAPSGMKTAMGGAELGFYFYIPEAWSVANQGDIASAFPSKIAKTSATFVKTEMPDGALGEAISSDKSIKLEDSVIVDYFASLDFPYAITVTEGFTATEFGNADKAWSYVIQYEVESITVKTLQYFVLNGEELYLFTYTSNNAQSFSGESNYEFYFDGVDEMIKAFKFVDKTDGANSEDSREVDGDGYALFNDPALSGFALYAPKEYSLQYSSGAVGLDNGRGAQITASEISYNSLTLEDYMMGRIEALEALFGKVTAKDGSEITKTDDIKADALTARDDLYAIFCYEYRYEYRGESYAVYQTLISPKSGSFYAITFTCPEADLDSYLDQIGKILDKVDF